MGNLADRDSSKCATTCDANVVDLFLSTLAAATIGDDSVPDGYAVCHFLYQHALCSDVNHGSGETNKTLQFTPPTRTLIGVINGMDISLLRDKEDVHRSRFTLLFSDDRAKGRKLARLHAEIDNDSTLFIRGVYVQEQYRQLGLSTLILAVFSHLCRLTFGSYPETHVMNKPLLCVALESLGFRPESTKWPTLVAPHEADKDVTLISSLSGDGVLKLGPKFPHAVRRAQKLLLVPELDPIQARQIHVLTRFLAPMSESAGASGATGSEANDRITERLANTEYQLYSARIVAFFWTLDKAKGLMFCRSQAVRNCQEIDR